MLFSFDTLAEWFPEHDGKRFAHIETVVLDSRKKARNGLFIPIVGERFNAHDFIEQAVENGAVAALWAKTEPAPAHLKSACHFFYVDDTLAGLHQLATRYRNEVDPIVVGITGSNGKTTTKDLVASVLSTTYKTHYTRGNFNDHIGLPQTILEMPRDAEVLVVEMGMSSFGEIDRLTKIARPDYAIVTNIGESHIEFLGSREGIAKAKLEILNGLKENGVVIVDGDEPLLNNVPKKFETIRCGFSNDESVTYQIRDIALDIDSTSFSVNGKRYTIPLVGRHHAKNAAYVLALAKKLNVTEENIDIGFRKVQHTGMRFEKMETKEGAVIINDAYNASPTSMMAAIDVIKSMPAFNKKILVLGDIFELGEQAETFHKQIGKAIDETIDVVFTMGTNAKFISEEAKRLAPEKLRRHFADKYELVNALKPHLTKGVVVLFKASRGMAFENIVAEIISA